MNGELLMLTVLLVVIWGVALVTYLPTIQTRRRTEQDETREEHDDAA